MTEINKDEEREYYDFNLEDSKFPEDNPAPLVHAAVTAASLDGPTNGGKVYEFFRNIPEQASQTASQLWNSMKEAYPHMKEGFNNCLSNMATALNPKTAPERISSALESVGKFFDELKEQIKNDKRPIGVKISETWNAFTKMITDAYNKFAEKASPALNAAGEKFAKAWDTVKESRAASMAANAAEKAKEVGKDLVGKIYDVGKSIYNSIPGIKKDNDTSKGV